MTLLLPLLAAGACAPYANVLDTSQVTQRATRSETQAVSGALHLEDPRWESPLERARLIDEALGGQIMPDVADRAGVASMVRARSTTVEPGRVHRGVYPLGL